MNILNSWLLGKWGLICLHPMSFEVHRHSNETNYVVLFKILKFYLGTNRLLISRTHLLRRYFIVNGGDGNGGGDDFLLFSSD